MTNCKKVLRSYLKISPRTVRHVIEYIDFSDEPLTALDVKLTTSKMSKIPIDDISLDWYFYQYDDDIYYRRKYRVITL